MSADSKPSNVYYLATEGDEPRRKLLARTIEDHEVALKRFLRVRLASESDRDDIAQEVFLRLCRRNDLARKLSYGMDSTRAYIFTIAVNLIRDMKRRSAVRHADAHEFLDERAISDDKPSVEDRLQSLQELETIAEIIRRMPKRCRRAFVMSRFDGKCYREIAETMGISCSMVEKHISAALAQIRDGLRRQS